MRPWLRPLARGCAIRVDPASAVKQHLRFVRHQPLVVRRAQRPSHLLVIADPPAPLAHSPLSLHSRHSHARPRSRIRTKDSCCVVTRARCAAAAVAPPPPPAASPPVCWHDRERLPIHSPQRTLWGVVIHHRDKIVSRRRCLGSVSMCMRSIALRVVRHTPPPFPCAFLLLVILSTRLGNVPGGAPAVFVQIEPFSRGAQHSIENIGRPSSLRLRLYHMCVCCCTEWARYAP